MDGSQKDSPKFNGNKKPLLEGLSESINDLKEGMNGSLNETHIDIKVDEKVATHDQGCGNELVCLIEDSPYRIHKLAAKGNLSEFHRIAAKNPECIHKEDNKGKKPIHHAAESGNKDIINAIINYYHGDVNCVDFKGNTPLHCATLANNKYGVECLLSNGADPSILNYRNVAPIHLAVETNAEDVLKTLVANPSIDLNLRGDNGATPLHYAGWSNNSTGAAILLEHKAKLCQPCDGGVFPMHVAAKAENSKTLEVMLKYAEKNGYQLKHVLNFKDQDDNLPLHAAVNGGNFDIVKTCLNSGASIDAQQEDLSTPVHIAAAQGAFDILQLMFTMQPDKKDICLETKDVLGMTPICKAVNFDRTEVVKYLLEQGANPEVKDNEGMTPLLLACSHKSWDSLSILLKDKRVNSTAKDNKKRNILHILIKNAGRLQSVRCCLCSSDIRFMLNEKDDFGCTPLHYASKEGLLKTIKSLIEFGASPHMKNNNQQGPLFFAARYGRYNTCKCLLGSTDGKKMINDTDGRGKSPTHAAAEGGHVKVLQLFLQMGATMLRDMKGNTPLHLAVDNGYTHTAELLLRVHPQLLDNPNKAGNTPIHLAACNGHASSVTLLLTKGAKLIRNIENFHFFDIAIKKGQKDVCIAAVMHDRWREIFSTCSVHYGCPVVGLIKQLPEVCLMLLDRFRSCSTHDANSKEFHYTYNFKFLELPMEKIKKLKDNGEDHFPLFALNKMVLYNRVELLSHPVCVAFLRNKWLSYGVWFYSIIMTLYTIFLASLTTFIATYSFVPMGDIVSDGNVTIHEDPEEIKRTYTYKEDRHIQLSGHQKITIIIILMFCVVNVIKELVQIYQQRIKYFLDVINLLEWVLYVSSALFVGPFLAGWDTKTQWDLAAISVFLAWLNLLLFLQRFDFFGIYVVMFLQILKTLLKVVIVFSILIVAFGLAFYIIMYRETIHSFTSPGLSLITTSIMMLGNIEYTDGWVKPLTDGTYQTLHHTALAFIILILFIMLMPILLMNLLIGLAVGDIEAVQKDARLKRLAMQVELHTDIERKLPHKLLAYVNVVEVKVYPNSSSFFVMKLWNKLTKFKGLSVNRDDECQQKESEEMMHQAYMYQELHKQKKRLKDITCALDKQYDLMKLMVQKMEIKMEEDIVDEGGEQNPTIVDTSVTKVGWSSASVRHNLMKQASTVARWRSTSDQDLNI